MWFKDYKPRRHKNLEYYNGDLRTSFITRTDVDEYLKGDSVELSGYIITDGAAEALEC